MHNKLNEGEFRAVVGVNARFSPMTFLPCSRRLGWVQSKFAASRDER